MRGVTGARTTAHTSSDPGLTMDTRQEPWVGRLKTRVSWQTNRPEPAPPSVPTTTSHFQIPPKYGSIPQAPDLTWSFVKASRNKIRIETCLLGWTLLLLPENNMIHPNNHSKAKQSWNALCMLENNTISLIQSSITSLKDHFNSWEGHICYVIWLKKLKTIQSSPKVKYYPVKTELLLRWDCV